MKLTLFGLLLIGILAAYYRPAVTHAEELTCPALPFSIVGTKAGELLCAHFTQMYEGCNQTAIDQYNYCFGDEREFDNHHVSEALREKLKREHREFCIKTNQLWKAAAHSFCKSYWLNEGCSLNQLKIIFETYHYGGGYIEIGIDQQNTELVFHGLFEKELIGSPFQYFEKGTPFVQEILRSIYASTQLFSFWGEMSLTEIFQLPCDWADCQVELAAREGLCLGKLSTDLINYPIFSSSIQARLKADFNRLPEQQRKEIIDLIFHSRKDNIVLEAILTSNDLSEQFIQEASHYWDSPIWKRLLEISKHVNFKLPIALRRAVNQEKWMAVRSLLETITQQTTDRKTMSLLFMDDYIKFVSENKIKIAQELNGNWSVTDEYYADSVMLTFLEFFQEPALYEMLQFTFKEIPLLQYFVDRKKYKYKESWSYTREFFFEHLAVELTPEQWKELVTWINEQVPDFIQSEQKTFFNQY